MAWEARPLTNTHSRGRRHVQKFKICLQPSEKCASHFGKKISIKMVEIKKNVLLKSAQIMWGPD